MVALSHSTPLSANFSLSSQLITVTVIVFVSVLVLRLPLFVVPSTLSRSSLRLRLPSSWIPVSVYVCPHLGSPSPSTSALILDPRLRLRLPSSWIPVSVYVCPHLGSPSPSTSALILDHRLRLRLPVSSVPRTAL